MIPCLLAPNNKFYNLRTDPKIKSHNFWEFFQALIQDLSIFTLNLQITELSAELADERNTGESASQLLETETSERLRLEKDMKDLQVKMETYTHACTLEKSVVSSYYNAVFLGYLILTSTLRWAYYSPSSENLIFGLVNALHIQERNTPEFALLTYSLWFAAWAPWAR